MARRYRSISPQPKVPAMLRPAALLRHFRGGRLMFNEVAGELWVTNSYMAARLGEKSPLIDWLALYNLTPEPMCCTVEATVQRNENEPPDIARVVLDASVLKKCPEITRLTIGSAPVLIEGENAAGQLEVWEAGGERICMNPSNRRMAEAIGGDGTWRKGTKPPLGPIFRVDALLKPVAVAMPVRNLAVMADTEEAA